MGKSPLVDELAAVRAALAAAHGPDQTFIDQIAALEKAVDLLLRQLEAQK